MKAEFKRLVIIAIHSCVTHVRVREVWLVLAASPANLIIWILSRCIFSSQGFQVTVSNMLTSHLDPQWASFIRCPNLSRYVLLMTVTFQSTVGNSKSTAAYLVYTKHRDGRDARQCGFVESKCCGRLSRPPLLVTCRRNCRRREVISVAEHDAGGKKKCVWRGTRPARRRVPIVAKRRTRLRALTLTASKCLDFYRFKSQILYRVHDGVDHTLAWKDSPIRYNREAGRAVSNRASSRCPGWWS